jgi:hypothetical protein
MTPEELAAIEAREKAATPGVLAGAVAMGAPHRGVTPKRRGR